LENHDEPRAAATFPPERQRAAAVAALTQSGARLVHHGQTTGAKVHLPVFLGRAPAEEPDADLAAFYRPLLGGVTDRALRGGEWALAATSGWPGNDRWGDLVAWSWRGGTGRWLIVVNLGDATASGHVAVASDDLRDRDWHLADPTTGVAFDRRGD